jgi:hypothetical protein
MLTDPTPASKDTMANWIKREDPTICCLQETNLIDRNKHWLRVKSWKIYQANGLWKQAGIAILTWDKVDFQLKLVKQDKEGHFILIKGAIHQEKIKIMNLYASSFIKHTLKDLKAHIDSKTGVVGDFNTSLSPIDRSPRQKNQQRNPRAKWHQRSNEPNWCLQTISSNNSTIYIVLSIPWNFLQNRPYLRASLNKFKKTDITPCILSDHNAIKLEINNKSSSRKYANNWRLNNTLLNDQWVIEEIREEIKNPGI